MTRFQAGWWGKLRDNAEDGINLRAWFAFYLLWLIGLTAAAKWGLAEIGATGSLLGWAIWLYCLYAFYLSLCNFFVPAPTTWIVMLLASDYVAQAMGLGDRVAFRIVLAATVGALATGIANLTEYHVFVYLLRLRRVAKIRDLRVYRWAEVRFNTNPFLILVAVGFLPIPVDVVRWLAITGYYSRVRYFVAYFIGRWGRYAIWAAMACAMSLSMWQIIALQAGLVGLAMIKILARWLWRTRKPAEQTVVQERDRTTPDRSPDAPLAGGGAAVDENASAGGATALSCVASEASQT